jgi:hypothetical protein
MPEFYDQCTCDFQPLAQPYLDAIARGLKGKPASRAFILKTTNYAHAYAGAEPLWQEQWTERDRDRTEPMKCPFWSNYFYDKPCQSCDCRSGDSCKRIEIDAIFFLRNAKRNTLAMHIEMKRDDERFSPGQAEAYKPRAACYRDQRRLRKGVLAHDHFITVLFCGIGTDIPFVKQHFDRVILHQEAKSEFPEYPTG